MQLPSTPQGKLLVSIDQVHLAHLLSGEETPLANGRLDLTLVRVQLPPSYYSTPLNSRPGTPSRGSPTDTKSSAGNPFKDPLPPIPARPSSPNSAYDEYLLLSLSDSSSAAGGEPIFEMVVPSNSRIISQPPRSYIIPNTQQSAADESSGFIKLTLPEKTATEERETLEQVLWGLTSFTAAGTSQSTPAPLQRTVSNSDLRNQLVLVDDHGKLVGALSENLTLNEDSDLKNSSHEKEPVVISAAGATSTADFNVTPLSSFVAPANPTNSSIISAGTAIGKGLVSAADALSRQMTTGADKYVQTRPKGEKPLVFSPATKAGVDKTYQLSGKAVVLSGKAAKLVGDAAGNLGSRLGKGLGVQSDGKGAPPSGLKGFLNKSFVAVNVIFDGLDQGGKTLLASGGQSANKVVNHTYGQEAAALTARLGGSVQHVALVYIDARGVGRKAIVKGVGGGMFAAKMADGREVLLDSDNGKGLVGTANETQIAKK